MDLRLGNAGRSYCPDAHAWFAAACERIGISPADVALQWNTLAKITAVTAVTGVAPDEVATAESSRHAPRSSTPTSPVGSRSRAGNMAAIFHRLRLTLFHAGRLDSHTRPKSRLPVSVTGWAVVAPAFAENARRYVAQVELSLRPATTRHIESDLREFGTWLADAHPDVTGCAELERHRIEHYKTWVSAKHGRYTGKPLSRISVKNRLVNLHCFFDRITEWGYPRQPPAHQPVLGPPPARTQSQAA